MEKNNLLDPIDFDDASKEWRANKKALPNGFFVYTCNYIHSNNKKCTKPIETNKINSNKINLNKINQEFLFNSYSNMYCKKHYKYLIDIKK